MAVQGKRMKSLVESVHFPLHYISLVSSNDDATEKKRAKTQMENGDVKASPSSGSGNALNLPIANPKAKAAIVKVYGDDTDGSFSLNDCYEFVGIVSLDPSLAAFPTDGTENDVVEQFGQQERLAKSPPPSLVPRHVDT